jgi:hypothetical protein
LRTWEVIDHIGKITHASISPPHEDDGLVSLRSFQNSEFDDPYGYDFDKNDLEHKLLSDDRIENIFAPPFNEDRGSQGYVVTDMHF